MYYFVSVCMFLKVEGNIFCVIWYNIRFGVSRAVSAYYWTNWFKEDFIRLSHIWDLWESYQILYKTTPFKRHYLSFAMFKKQNCPLYELYCRWLHFCLGKFDPGYMQRIYGAFNSLRIPCYELRSRVTLLSKVLFVSILITISRRKPRTFFSIEEILRTCHILNFSLLYFIQL